MDLPQISACMPSLAILASHQAGGKGMRNLVSSADDLLSTADRRLEACGVLTPAVWR